MGYGFINSPQYLFRSDEMKILIGIAVLILMIYIIVTSQTEITTQDVFLSNINKTGMSITDTD